MRQHGIYPKTLSSIASARRFVQTNLADMPQEITDSAVLLVSELATNAIQHAGTGFELDLAVEAGDIRIAVTDQGQGKPIVRTPTFGEPSGRGLQLVKSLSDDWGVQEGPTQGKTIWFMLHSDNRAANQAHGRVPN